MKSLEEDFKNYKIQAQLQIKEKTQLAKDLEEIVHHHEYEKDYLLEYKEKCKILNQENEKLMSEISKLKSLKDDNEKLKEKFSIDVKSLILDVSEFNILELPLESLKIGAKNILNFTQQEMEKGISLENICKRNEFFESLLDKELIYPLSEILRNGMIKGWLTIDTHPLKVIMTIKDEELEKMISETNRKIGNMYNDDLHLNVFLKFLFQYSKTAHFWRLFGENKDLINQYYESYALINNKKNIEIIKKILLVISKLPFEYE